MKTCVEYQELISVLLDGELTDAEQAEVKVHTAHCPECRAMYEAFSAVSAVEAEEVPDTLHTAVMDRVVKAHRALKTQGRIMRLRPILATAACLVVIVGTVFAAKNATLRNHVSEAPMAAPTEAAPASAAAGAAEAEEGAMMKGKAAMKTANASAKADVPEEPAAPAAPAPAPAPAPAEAAVNDCISSTADIVEMARLAPESAVQAAEPEEEAENTLIAEITFVSDIRLDAVTEDGLPVAVLMDGNTQISDEVHRALTPGCVICITYRASELTDGMVIHADEISLAE